MSISRVHPAANKCHDLLLKEDAHARPSMLTVWQRSSMSFQGTDGFTVFDHHGSLVFRVDNYSRMNRSATVGGLILMDGTGNALLTLKPQILSMQYQWNAYREGNGRGKSARSKVFSMRSPSLLFHSGKHEAEVFMGGSTKQIQTPDFRIEGSFRTRNCKIRTSTGELVAKIARKRVNTTILLSDDVFSLVVQPGFDTQLIMAFVVILDRICSKTFASILCS